MAIDTRQRGVWWSRLHFIVRFLGVTGLAVAVVGLFLVSLDGLLTAQGSVWERPYWGNLGDEAETMVQSHLKWFDSPEAIPPLATTLLLGGVVAGLFALVIEIMLILTVVAGRRSAFGFNWTVQVALAVALVVGVNVYSFNNHWRFDWTWGKKFTLDPEIEKQMRALREEGGKTTIVVYQRHKTFARFSEKTDAFDYAAEEKVVEKVHDLVDQFRNLGPQFEVIVLDVRDKERDEGKAGDLDEEDAGPPARERQDLYRARPESYSEKVRKLPENLQKAIEDAPENSIFFHARGKVQRMSFNDFYRLDRHGSRQRGNLVLDYQGVGPFARKVLSIEQKKPVVGIPVVHKLLGTQSDADSLTLAGLRKALISHGYEVRDIIVKKGLDTGDPPESVVNSAEEDRFDEYEEEILDYDASIKERERELQVWQQRLAMAVVRLTGAMQPTGEGYLGALAFDARQVGRLQEILEDREKRLKDLLQERDQVIAKQTALNLDRVAELRRLSDLRLKLDRALADCDLLIVPRLTLRNVTRRDYLPSRIYRMDELQTGAVKDFLIKGKPVLACFGPTNERPGDERRLAFLGAPGADDLEKLLGELGLRFSNQTILFEVEEKKFSQRGSTFAGGEDVAVPSVGFHWKASAKNKPRPGPGQGPVNPLRASMYLTARSVGQRLDLPVRNPRPIYYDPDRKQQLSAIALLVGGPAAGDLPLFAARMSSVKVSWPDAQAEFILTAPEAWNEDRPFATDDRLPHFEPPEPGSPTIGTLDEVRRGQFPIAVAVETPLPLSWTLGRETQPTVRIAAIGSGSVFVGPELAPAKEKLLVDTCNWLLGRDDHLASEGEAWQYPRVEMTPREHKLWKWGAWVGLPGIFAYLGLVVLLVRRLR